MTWGARKRERGYSIIEVMVAMALLGFIAMALLPAMLTLTDTLKLHAFRSQCNAIVRAKLQEYVNGVSATGTMGNSATGSGYIASGFEYTKKRFYDNSASSETVNGSANYYCQGDSASGVSAGHPGYRERVSSNRIISYTSGEDPSLPDIPDRLRGFQLFTNVRHFNPRVDVGLQPKRQCPVGSTYLTPNDYQFFRLGDALEVVVTGMIRVRPLVSQGGRSVPNPSGPPATIIGKFAGFDDQDDNTPNPRLVCSGSQIIYPPRIPFRYYLGGDGKIRNYQATLAFRAGAPESSFAAMEAHFRSLWSQAPSGGSTDSPVLANVRSFAVSPENNMVYVLRPGELKLYKNCTDQTVSISTPPASAVSIPEVPDCSIAAPDVYTWSIDSNIENITVDFKGLSAPNYETDDQVYGFFNTGGNDVGQVKVFTLPAGGGVGTLGAPATATFSVPVNKPRIRGIFIAQTFPSVTTPNLFYFDNTCPGAISGASNFAYCVGLFNSADLNMAMPVREMPVQVEGISY
ncbi:MAG: type II secretion system protein [Bdellovibrionota bacterium]